MCRRTTADDDRLAALPRLDAHGARINADGLHPGDPVGRRPEGKIKAEQHQWVAFGTPLNDAAALRDVRRVADDEVGVAGAERGDVDAQEPWNAGGLVPRLRLRPLGRVERGLLDEGERAVPRVRVAVADGVEERLGAGGRVGRGGGALRASRYGDEAEHDERKHSAGG